MEENDSSITNLALSVWAGIKKKKEHFVDVEV